MNPGEFANPGAGPGRPALPVGMRPMKANMQQKNDNIQAVMNHVASVITSQGPYGGWKATVQVKDRALHIYQMISSLRLIQPSIGLSQAAQAAMSFESKAFSKANERDDYDKECTEKLLHIKDTRERQAAVAYQSGMMPQTGAVPNQMPVGFPQQMNQNLQGSPVAGQNQMSMGMNNAALQQQQQQQRQQQQSQAMLQQQAQQQAQSQRTQQRPANGIPLPDDLNTLSPQDLDHVSRLANEMLSKTSPEDMEKIKLNLSNMTPEQRQYLARKNLDPMTYFFRSQALGQIRRHRRARAEIGRTQNAGIDPNGNMMGDPMMNSQQQRQAFQNMLNLQRNNAFPGNPGQSMEPPNFMGNVENIQGQQADGLRSQEAGQLVVPASSSQMNQAPFPNNNHNNMFPQQMGQNGQANMNGDNVNAQAQAQAQFLAQQQHMQGGSNVPQDRMQFQAQAQAQARAQAAQKAQMAISGHGGQANPQGQSQLTGQSPGMPMLNQPMAPGQMSPVQVHGQTRPPSRPMSQHPGSVPGQAAMQGRPPMPPNIPQHIQDQIARMTPEQAQAFMLTQQRRAMSNMARNPAQQPASLQQNQPQPGQPQQMLNNQMGNPMMRGSMNVPQEMNPGGLPQGQQLTPQQRQQRQNEMFKLQLLRQQNNGVEMTPDQSKQMDRVAFPPSILNMNGTSMQVPKNVKNWGQLKQWAASNSGGSRPNDMSRLMVLQKLHLGQLLSSGTGLVKDPNVPGQQATPFQSTQNQFPNPQGFPVGQQQPPPNMAGMRPITAQDIQMARQKLGPQSANFTDEQIRDILHRNRQRQLMQAAQNRAMQMEGNMPPGQQGQPTTQPPFPSGQAIPQPKPQPPQQTQPPADPQSLVKAQAAANAKSAKAVAGKPASKKRPSTDDTPDDRNMATPQQNQTVMPSGTGAGPTRSGMPFTPEQLAQMTPQQRAQVDAHMWRQQQAQPKVLSRVAAEEAWNKNLPPQVMEVYNEISKAAPPAKPLPISPEDKVLMTNQLRDSLQVLGRLDTLVQWYAKVPGQEKNVRNLLAMRIQLMRQFKPSQDWIVNDQFTITNDYLHGAVMFMKRLFQLMLTRIQQQSQRSNAAQPPAPAAPNAQGNMPALNATNLQQLQAQEEALQRARRASSQSATVPPAPFGAPSPSGVPHAYGPGGLAPENLKLPPPKRRKQSHAGIASSPIQANGAPVAAVKYNKQVADAKSTAAALAGAFKCSVVECQHHYQGFPTQVALDKHVEESHQPEEEEVIDDYLKYYHESISIGLGLNPNDPQVPQAAPTGFAPLSNKINAAASPAKQSIATPVLGNMTPMARVTSHLGGKTASPSTSTQLLTPQQSAKGAKPAAKSGLEDSEPKDPWADCPTSLDALHDTFSNLASKDLPYLGYDPLEDFNINEATPEDDWLALGTLTPPDETDQAAFMDNFYEPWDEDSIALAAATIRIPPEIQVKGEGPMGQLEVDWDAVARFDKEGISIPIT
ncbi:hypothetical protein PENANT_c014G02265 [Penicillium antarcticum]|uniref:Mediator complex subunit 15 KIX domain-containing protein n=1 Tax=Penicillium antarcticum TaxID=416450 RepID=A0A1V6Q564_9EURO|nr:uncharacterized protein N7508_009546 [Penicillium antarcticum]KAJ5294725.1 hypothetical protein N7508_009546 [Penicillium antarcticum]OQD83926.1 hypothetical protein PENANT_c014G02265 [Penicillium antarcticum]